MTFRCAIFAAVSSRPQVEKESIPSQIANARAHIQRRNWQEAVEPLIVPGESRDIDFLHEAIEEIAAMRQLIALARAQTIDLVVIRDYDRLARTRSLLTQISAYLNRCQVQIYALNKPVEPLPVEELARTGQASMTSATIEAFAGLEAQREIDRLRERLRFGMDGLAKKGLWKHVTPPFGYRREIVTDSGDVIYLDIPEIVTEHAAIVRRIEDLYLGGQSMRQIARTLNLETVPSATDKAWTQAAITNILHNPFYSGWIVWGLKRTQKVYAPTSERFVSRAQNIPAYAQLCALHARRPNLQDLLDARESLVADGVVIERGKHTPLRTEERQAEIDHEVQARQISGGRGASITAKQPRIFSGLLKCATCGSSMTAKSNAQGYVYYYCPRTREGACANTGSVREEQVYAAVCGVIRSFTTADAIDNYLDAQGEQDSATLRDTISSITAALQGVTARRARWDSAYEGGVIELQTYGQKLIELETEAARLQAALTTAQQRLAAHQDHAQRRARLLAWQPPALSAEKRGTIKQQMRSLVEHIEIAARKVVKIAFR